ncbi:hypothetical protein COEREDRAFT_12370 [Coemansia reversa NRRL 1564]|uniref:Uncharacterized protein n=1 Tax=Coemansia reversa (strain ATCC 12441 / NRRL 1564) TaxID=763665 RepID=A0A2G5B1T6_COERN|nr:hypothetical protein COEREDRAFT_12370 [Coemansia reversa NRRL 1564]|eukprot:PIA12677.1 hypothetical protein COEREDRAFT_12370 [Coemansia reversa NRRL 1564]
MSTISTDDPTNGPQYSPSMLSTAMDSGSTPSGPPPPHLYASAVSAGLSATGTAPTNTNGPLTASTHPPAHNSRNTDGCTRPGYHPNPTGTTGPVGAMGPSSQL